MTTDDMILIPRAELQQVWEVIERYKSLLVLVIDEDRLHGDVSQAIQALRERLAQKNEPRPAPHHVDRGMAVNLAHSAIDKPDAVNPKGVRYLADEVLRMDAVLRQHPEPSAEPEFYRVHEALEKQAGIHVSQQASAEPVAWRTFNGVDGYNYRDYDENENYAEKWAASHPLSRDWVDRLYLDPPPRTPLTDETLWEMWVESPSDVLRFARAIERAHGIGEKQ